MSQTSLGRVVGALRDLPLEGQFPAEIVGPTSYICPVTRGIRGLRRGICRDVAGTEDAHSVACPALLE